MFKDASDALTFIDKEGIELVDVRFCDLPGIMQHFTIPVSAFKDDALTNGLMFDGSSISSNSPMEVAVRPPGRPEWR